MAFDAVVSVLLRMSVICVSIGSRFVARSDSSISHSCCMLSCDFRHSIYFNSNILRSEFASEVNELMNSSVINGYKNYKIPRNSSKLFLFGTFISDKFGLNYRGENEFLVQILTTVNRDCKPVGCRGSSTLSIWR